LNNQLFKPGNISGEVTPVSIPNTEVKLPSADGTARVTVWESRTLPGFFFAPVFFVFVKTVENDRCHELHFDISGFTIKLKSAISSVFLFFGGKYAN
jgi:hypothetical protein